MRWLPTTSLAVLLTAFSVFSGWAAAQPEQSRETVPQAPSFGKDIRPLLATYCFACHTATKKKAGLDLDQFATEAAALEKPAVWDQVGERVRAREMPPAKSKQPNDVERQQLLAWTEHVARAQVSRANLTREQLEKSTGPTQSRRLNRTEYNNTLRDLFGVDLHAGDLLPSEGGGGEGFDNHAGALFTSPVLLEKYLEAAERVLGTLFPAAAAGGDTRATNKVEADRLAALRRRLLVAVPGPRSEPRDAARKVLEAFLPRAFRRPAAAREVERYLGLFDQARRRGDSYEQSLKLALKGVLVSPSFLFLIDAPPDKPGAYPLGHYEVASHLSYFLWASMPDEELFRLAEQGRLHDEQVLRGQVRRMMRDRRARGLADSFAGQWLGIRALGSTIWPDARLFPEFTEELAAAMREETLLFFDSIVRDDGSVLQLLDADYTFLNEGLAGLYNVQGVKGPEMRRVRLDDPLRGGVLGHASILTVTSYPHRTSPVLRGRWVLEELLGTEVPPPPPDAPVLDRKVRTVQGVRQLLEKHRTRAECATCHQRMDPLGFGLENFDPLGRWRAAQDGQPIDSTGVLPGGDKFTGLGELKKLLLDRRRPEYVANLCRKLLGYALAREVNRVDRLVVDDAAKALEDGGWRISCLLETIVVSYPFRYRYHTE
jgi:mono/diheme cytochrome c family protein